MTERELRAVAVGIITYCSIIQTGRPPELDEEEQIVEAAAYLDNEILEQTLEICSYADIDCIEFSESEDE